MDYICIGIDIRRLGVVVLLPGEEGHSTGRNCEEGRYG